MLRRAFNTSRPPVLNSWVRGQAKCGIKVSPESLAPQQDAAILLPGAAYVNEGTDLYGFFCGFLICNSLRFCEESRKHCSSTEPCMWHRTCQAQQRKANAVAIATKRRLQEALAERRVDLISDSLTACGLQERPASGAAFGWKSAC